MGRDPNVITPHYRKKIKGLLKNGRKAWPCPNYAITRIKKCWNIVIRGEEACKKCASLKKGGDYGIT